MKYLKLFEQLGNEVAAHVAQLLSTKPFAGMPLDVLNNGWCHPFAVRLAKKLRATGKVPIRLSTTDFQRDSQDGPAWSTRTHTQLVDPSVDHSTHVWNLDNLERFGVAPVDLTDFYLDYHSWVYVDGKHYDAESPEGVDTFWELVFFQIALRQHQRRNA